MTDLNQPNAAPMPPADDEIAWQALLARRNDESVPIDNTPVNHLYGPLCRSHRAALKQGTFTIAHLAQSLDGRIATTAGVSRWLSGTADLLHTHRMRALADAVLVGVNTVLHDDPQLTVRRCAGSNPLRVVIDPERRLDGSQRIFHDSAAPTLLLAAADRAGSGETLGCAEILPVARGGTGLDPHEIRRLLAHRGMTWLFIEGGGITVSRFLAAGALDRLQLTIAPVILGSGRPGLLLPEITDLQNSLRPPTRRFILGDDIMVECDFNHG
jgi:riboflavin-specific deaminase-like protein